MKILSFSEAETLLKKWKHSGATRKLKILYEKDETGKSLADEAVNMDETALFETMEEMAEDDPNYIFAFHAMIGSEEFNSF